MSSKAKDRVRAATSVVPDLVPTSNPPPLHQNFSPLRAEYRAYRFVTKASARMSGIDLIDHSPSQPEAASRIPTASNLVLIDNFDSFTWK